MAIVRPQAAAAGTKSENFIPDEFIEQVNEHADILKVIERSVALKKSGSNNWLGLCPFHKEKSPSFTVSPAKGMYYCFGCGAAGGAISFLMEHDGTPFREAVRELAVAAGLALPPTLMGQSQDSAPSIDTAPLFSAMSLASRFFRHVLRHEQASLDYLIGRGLNADSLNKFQIGAAPSEWRGLQEAFPDYETNPYIVQSGLIREKVSTSEDDKVNRYDTFRNRIMFPIRDTRGRIVAFGGRELGQADPKYMNSPETPIFNKSGSLFGLFEAREAIRQRKMVIVVEGYFDVVMLSQCGVENAVACMGTHVTKLHVERLLTQADTVVYAFDGDAAGRKAALHAMEICLPLIEDHHDVRFLILPDGKDPDDLAIAYGADAFIERTRKAPSLSEFLIGELRLKHNILASTEDRARFAAEGSALANRLGYRTKLRGLLLRRISEESQVPGTVIKSLNQASNSRSSIPNLWSTLSKAAQTAPSVALVDRELLLELLDTDDERENAFAKVLEDLPADQADHPGDSVWLLARDTMKSAVDMISEYRTQQMSNEAKTKFQNGEITEAEFMRLALTM